MGFHQIKKDKCRCSLETERYKNKFFSENKSKIFLTILMTSKSYKNKGAPQI